MSAFIQLLIISISLAMDALSVSIAGGLKSQKSKIHHAVKVAGFFGFFQGFMPLAGWLIGEMLSGFVTVIADWVAFALLSAIGIKMIKDSLSHEDSPVKDILNNKTLTLLAIATSIDALVVGISLSLMKIPLLLSVTVIGIITFIVCFFGFLFGKRLGKHFGKRIEIAGGITLILIGIKIIAAHYFI